MKKSVFLGVVMLLVVSSIMVVMIAERFAATNQITKIEASAFQPTAPYYITFFYPWYQNPNTDARWSQWSDPPNGSTTPHTPPQNWFAQYLPDPQPSVFDPANELYSSNNDQIIYWQLRKLAEAKQEVAIASWWGPTHKTNTALQKIITDVMNRSDNPYPNLRWGVYYEKEGFGDPAVDTELVPDLKYIIATFINQPSYFKINGRPVIFVYNAAHAGYSPMNDLSRWQQAKAKVKTDTGVDLYIVLKRDPLDAGAVTSAIDGWHEYAPAARTNTRAGLWFSVSPGFWLNGNTPRLTRDPAAFETGVQQMVAANVPWKITETWNEWGEGSGVEPADEVNQVNSGTATIKIGAPAFKNTYVDILSRNLPALEAGTGAGGMSPVVAAAGDIACGSGTAAGLPCKQMATSDLVVQMNPQTVIALGDLQYEAGAYNDFLSFYQSTWGRFKAKTRPVIGNHEYDTPGAKGYFDYFNGVNVQTGSAGDRAKGYYSYDIGAWHVVTLNSNCVGDSNQIGCGVGSEQMNWLKADLAANPRQCTLAVMHHPFYTSGDRQYPELKPIVQALYDAGVDLYLAGHTHFYQRFYPQDANGNRDDTWGLTEIVVGTGGKEILNLGNVTYPNMAVRNTNTHGVLKLVLNPTSYDWQFMPIAGQTFTDSGSTACHGPIAVSTKANVSLLLHGIGKGGDNVNPQGTGNMTPVRTQRNITLEIFDSTNQLATTRTGTVSFNGTVGSFTGITDLGNLATGVYTVRISLPQYLRKSVPGIFSFTAGQTHQFPSVTLISGDTNGDNRLSILDYNVLLDCFSDIAPARNCTDQQKKLAADLTDDSNVNQFDYNLFLRELSVQTGE